MSIGNNITLFYSAKPIIFERAKYLRLNMTKTEMVLWESLKGKQLLNLRFRAQHPIDIFIVDFYCHSLKLVIEFDGEIHDQDDQKEYDIGREFELKQWGIKVIRFSNLEINSDLDLVISKIKYSCKQRIFELKDKSPLQGI